MVFILLLAAGLAWFGWKRSVPAETAYREVAVTRGDIEAVILSTGTVQPENRLEIKPPIAGRIDNVLVQEGQVVKKSQVLAWMSSTERAALLDAASAKGPQELKRWEELYRATPILAPINGTIIVRSVEPGQTFTGQDSVFVISDRLTVKAQVDETDIAQIRLKQKAWLVLDAYPDQTIPGHVDQIAYDAKTVNNVTTYVVDVLPEKAPDFMRSGMTANVSFSSASAKNVLLLPSNAVRTRDGRSTVLIKSPDKNAKPLEKEVTLGITDGKRVAVSGVAEGDVILVAQLKSSAGNAGTNPFSPLSGRRPR
ncbi:MAG: efflux RND transporter periplasmic adaptor subunit [Gammaproteobacteria bacterium]|nr:efflux RND transporter periplasmic adaptor subunit [Gammaproteobacteria bacterium]